MFKKTLMYRKVSRALVIGLLLMPALAGSGAAVARDITFASASQGGTWYIIGGAFQQVLQKHIPGLKVATIATPGVTPENMSLLSKGEVQLGLATNNILYDGYNEKLSPKAATMFSPDVKSKLNTLRTIAVGAPSHFFLVTRKSSSIKSFTDLKGKKVAVMTAGSGTGTEIMKFLPGVFGLQPSKDFTPLYMTNQEAGESIKDGSSDAAFFTARSPISALMDLDNAKDIKFIQMTDAQMAKLVKAAPYLVPVSLPKGAYKGMTAEYKTVMLPSSVITTTDVDADLIYKITKTVFEHRDDLKAVHPGAADFSEKVTVSGHAAPLHPGTEKYMREKGFIK